MRKDKNNGVAGHHVFKDRAKNRVDDLRWIFSDLQSARKESRSNDVALLEEQVHQMLCEWKVELNEPSPTNSFQKIWKRICAETTTELNLLAENWKYILGGLICKYIHGLAARGVHYFHRPRPILQDVGFFLLPEFGQERAYISETMFTFIFLSFILGCQTLRILTFYSTQLPGLNYYCREGSKFATLLRPENILEVFVIIPRGVLFGCGDLIFSSHMSFSLVFVRTYQKYGTQRFIKQCAWLTLSWAHSKKQESQNLG